jgi:hypothetical protein
MRASVPPKLVEQRIRNRIYEYVEYVAEYPANRGAWDLNELVNEWETYVSDPFESESFKAPAFTPGEVAAIAEVHAAWADFANATPPTIKDEAQAMQSPQWPILVETCRKASIAFALRGKLAEE